MNQVWIRKENDFFAAQRVFIQDLKADTLTMTEKYRVYGVSLREVILIKEFDNLRDAQSLLSDIVQTIYHNVPLFDVD